MELSKKEAADHQMEPLNTVGNPRFYSCKKCGQRFFRYWDAMGRRENETYECITGITCCKAAVMIIAAS